MSKPLPSAFCRIFSRHTVKVWIDVQGSKFLLDFFMDEVGQYIADDVKLMATIPQPALTEPC